MIRVEVTIPLMNKAYEFSVNEYAKVNELIGEIVSIVSQKENFKCDSIDTYILSSATKGYMLPKDFTLYQCKIKQGERLVLV